MQMSSVTSLYIGRYIDDMKITRLRKANTPLLGEGIYTWPFRGEKSVLTSQVTLSSSIAFWHPMFEQFPFSLNDHSEKTLQDAV